MTTVTGIEKHYHPRKQRVEVDDGWVWNDRLKESIERLNSCSSDDHKKGKSREQEVSYDGQRKKAN